MLVTLSLSNTSRALSCALAFVSSAVGDALAAHAIELLEQHVSRRRERRAVGRRRRDRVEKRLLGRQQRAADRRGQTALDQRAIEARAALRRQAAEAGPEVQALRAGQHGIEHEQREEIRIADGRRVIADLQIGGRAFLANHDSALAGLLGLDRAQPRRLGPGGIAPK